MLTLYYGPGACSMASHIVLEESGEKYEPRRMDLAKGEKMLARDFAPEGRAKQTLKDVHLMLDQGERLGQELPMLKVHCDVLEACVRAGEAERDNSVIVEEIRRRRKPVR